MNQETAAAIEEQKSAAQLEAQGEAEPQKRKGAEPTGAINPREMTALRDELFAIRDLLNEGDTASVSQGKQRLNAVCSTIDKMDLRYRINWDPTVKAQRSGGKKRPSRAKKAGAAKKVAAKRPSSRAAAKKRR